MSDSYFGDNHCGNGFQSSRKRVPNSRDTHESKIDVPLPELDFNDPDFLKLLKEYERDEDDYPSSYAEREKELRALRMRAKDRPLLDQGSTYVCLILAFGLFVLLINWCNTKELQRLKQEFGHEAQRDVPEFWWKKAVVYRLHVPTFSDSDGDGVGDLKGVLDNLDYLTYLGVDAVVLRSIMEFTEEEGYIGVTNFTNIEPKLGSFTLLNLLLKGFHQRGMKVMVEVVPNHTSRKHPWFKSSRRSVQESKFRGVHSQREEEEGMNLFKDFYIWSDGKTGSDGLKIPPNNWVGADDRPAWTCEGSTGCYYHHFHRTLPDLNHRNFDVQREMLSTFKFWLDRGFDAIYLDHVSPLFESSDIMQDEPLSSLLSSFPGGVVGIADRVVPKKQEVLTYKSLSHIFTVNQPELHDYLGSWNEFVQSYSLKRNQRLSLLIDIPVDESNPEVGTMAKNFMSWVDMPILRSLMNINELCRGACLQETIEASIGRLPPGRDPMWMFGPKEEDGHSMPGIFHNVYNSLLMLLPGGVLMKAGSEMGDFEELQSIKSHQKPKHNYMYDRLVRNLTLSSPSDVVFLPPSRGGGSSATPSSSSLKVIHSLARLRKEPSFLAGQIQYAIVNENVFSFVRFARDEKPYLVSLNFGKSDSTEDYSLSSGVGRGRVVTHVPPHKRVVLVGGEVGHDAASSNQGPGDLDEGRSVDLSRLTLRPGEGVVVSLLLLDNRDADGDQTGENDDGEGNRRKVDENDLVF